jgi:hypothetical protein
MRCQGDEPTVTDGPTLAHEAVRMVPLLALRSIPTRPPLDCRPATLVNNVQSTTERVRQRQPVPRRQWQQPAFLRFPYLNVLDAFPLASLLAEHKPQVVRSLLADGTWTSIES